NALPTFLLYSCTLLSSISRRPPTLTLFPYTTLFRSRTVRAIASIQYEDSVLEDMGVCCVRLDEDSARNLSGVPGKEAAVNAHRRDRKSTRLNSSHVKISYAVFCLKKKIGKDSIGNDV